MYSSHISDESYVIRSQSMTIKAPWLQIKLIATSFSIGIVSSA